MKKNRLFASALVLSFLTSTTAFAGTPRVYLDREIDKDSATLYLYDAGENISSVELSLTANSNNFSAAFDYPVDGIYDYCKIDGDTLTIYVDALTSLATDNSNTINLGILNIVEDVTFSGVKNLIVIDTNGEVTKFTDVELENATPPSKPRPPRPSRPDSGNSENSTTDKEDNQDKEETKPEVGRPNIVGEHKGGMVIANDDGSVTIKPDEGYQVKDVLVNGISQGAVLQLLNLKETDKVEVIFEATSETVKPDLSKPTNFTDIKTDSWYAAPVSYVTQRGLFSGVSETEFAPTQNMTRGMLVSVLYRLDGANYSGSGAFTDVADTAWYANPVNWAHENHLVSGITEDTFAPNAPVTREQAAVMMARYLQFAGVTLENSTADFNDADNISGYAKDSVAAMQKAGLLSGDENGNFRPKAEITRAEIASIFMRLCETYNL